VKVLDHAQDPSLGAKIMRQALLPTSSIHLYLTLPLPLFFFTNKQSILPQLPFKSSLNPSYCLLASEDIIGKKWIQGQNLEIP
jgi:hypothetical protein